MPVSYPLDLSGVAASNLVSNELHSVNESQFHDYHFIVPSFAPFFIDNFKATISLNGVERDMVEDVDFSFALRYVTGTRTTGKAMYGAITLHNLSVNGIIKLRYQTLGGDEIADRLLLLTILAEKAYNPKTTIWENVINLPNSLPPTPHYNDYRDFYGQEELVAALNGIKDAIAANSSLTAEEIRGFLQEVNNMSYLPTSGGTLTGPLTLHANPVDANNAANKAYVDDGLSTLGNTLGSAISGLAGGQNNIAQSITDINEAIGEIIVRLNTGDVGIDTSVFATTAQLNNLGAELTTYANILPQV